MGVTARHPSLAVYSPLWKKMKDCFAGEDHIKSEGPKYLPVPASMRMDGMQGGEPGAERYADYKQRSVFPEYVYDAVVNYTGILHRKDSSFSLPKEMQYMLERASNKGESLTSLLRRINELQLKEGRCGLLLDLPAVASTTSRPYIALYEADAITNWDTGEDQLGYESLNLVILDESKNVMNHETMEWEWKMQYRKLSLGSDATDEPSDSGAKYKTQLVVVPDGESDPQGEDDAAVIPMYQGKTLEKIPFVFCNAMDIIAEPDRPPLLALANKSLAIYRGEADYRQNLYMQGQDSLVVKGRAAKQNPADPESPIRTGAGAVIEVGQEGDAKYIGVQSQGLPEQRKSLETDHSDAASRSGQLTRTDQASQESGEALRTRVAAKTASLVGIAYTGAFALQTLLRQCAEWMGLNPDEVIVTPNIDFSKTVLLGQDFVQIMTSLNLGAPLSRQSVHGWLADNSMTTLTFEEEMKRIKEEQEKYPFLAEMTGKADQNAVQQVSDSKGAKKPNPQTK